MTTKDLFDQIRDVLKPSMGDASARRALIESALFGSNVLGRIVWEGAELQFTSSLINRLVDFGEIEPGRPAIVALLDEVKKEVGVDRQARIEKLIELIASEPNLLKVQSLSAAEKISIVKTSGAEDGSTDEILRKLRTAIQDPQGYVVLSIEQARAIKDNKPLDLGAFRIGRITEWSMPQYQIDRRFVNLTLLLDKGENENQRWQKAEDYRFNDLRDVLKHTVEYPALVVLGSPGCGKSTLLRRLQLDHSSDYLDDDSGDISFFVPLNRYRSNRSGVMPEPAEWLNERWSDQYPGLPGLEGFMQSGRALLLLDALNEMPHMDTNDYRRLVGLWRDFTEDAARKGNRIIFSCRSLDYSAPLSSKDLRVPQIEVQPLSDDQMLEFISRYAPDEESFIWGKLYGSPQFDLFRIPYFLKLFCDQVESTGQMPEGRAGLFTGLIRQAIAREINSDHMQVEGFFDDLDQNKLSNNIWGNPFDLPDRGILIQAFSDLAYNMQEKGFETEGSQVRINYDDARRLISCQNDMEIIKAGVDLGILDLDLRQYDLAFSHQLLQEYFASRRLSKEPDPGLVHVEWVADRVIPPFKETLAGLSPGDPLPPLPQTGWEETTLTAAPMAKDPVAFIRDLIQHNLPLAARCAASPEVKIDAGLKRQIQDQLIARTQDMKVDLRARISAGEALGEIGDPRFEVREGPHGEYLLPPMVEIPAGTYPIGDDESRYDFEKPAHKVELPSFKIGMFPVTNAEYAKFIDAGGYEDDQWWDTEEMRAWRRGEASTEGSKVRWREVRSIYVGKTDDEIRELAKQYSIVSHEDIDFRIEISKMTDDRFEEELDDLVPTGKIYDRPEFWDDIRFNNPAQPVVGVTWFEARAYCNWLTANAGVLGVSPSGAQSNDEKARLKTELRTFRLPTEVEVEAAARGVKGRMFPYEGEFDKTRCNTFENHIRRSTPIGIFNNAMPEGAFDLSGNVYTWTTSIYDQDKYPYPWQDDERENIKATGVRRGLRGGSWDDSQVIARAVFRDYYLPLIRLSGIGFRVVSCGGPPS